MVCTYGSPGCPEAVKKPCVYMCRLCVCVCTYTKICVCTSKLCLVTWLPRGCGFNADCASRDRAFLGASFKTLEK